MTAEDWLPVPLRWSVDLDHGGRWTSLRAGDREWLWTNADAAVLAARRDLRGPAFVDGGGGEECWPTVRGEPDHGAAWSPRWSGDSADAWVEVASLGRLRRQVSGWASVEVAYEITGPPDTGFLHALHLLLDVDPQARLVMPGADRMRVLDSDDPDRRWPDGLDRLGPDDGSAVCALIPLGGAAEVLVIDGDHALRLQWSSVDQPDLCSLLLWRNLRGWPEQAPYRSIGVEPMLGRAADWRTAADDDLARIGPSGQTRWSLTLRAYVRGHVGPRQ